MRALIIGSTGATGKDLVNTLLKDTNYDEIIAFVRRPSEISHQNLTEIVTDFDHLEKVSENIYGDVLFSCLGTTLKDAGSKEKQKHIDYEIPLNFAKAAKNKGIKTFVLVSSYGASSESKIFYSRLKGELERDLEKIDFAKYIIFRPGSLLRKGSNRWAERLSVRILKLINRLGFARKFRPLSTQILAEKLAKAPLKLGLGKHIISLEKIFQF